MTAFVLITPAHDEEAFIGQTLTSVVQQSVRPASWVVVDDASTDATCRIVEDFARRHDFIRLIRVERTPGRHFGNKVRAFNRGLEALQDVHYNYVGNLDADIVLSPGYFRGVLGEMEKDPRLGIAGGMVHTRIGDRFRSQSVAPDSVAGAVQMFRRECFEAIGGYPILPLGGIDAAAEITARMLGFGVRTFPEFRVFEQRRTGSVADGPLSGRVTEGRRLHSLGYSLPFFLARRLYRALEPPPIIGSAAAIFGFLGSMLRGAPVVLPSETVRFLRKEQHRKLMQLVLPRAR